MAEIKSPHFINFPLTITSIQTVISPFFDGEVSSIREIEKGWNNKALKLVTKSSNNPLLLRLSKNTWPKEKIENEVAGLHFVNQNFNNHIPTPKVLGWGIATDEFPMHYMLMEYIDGDNLEDIWRDLQSSDKLDILKSIGFYLNQLQSVKFDSIGGWKFNETGSDVVVCPYFDNKCMYQNENEMLQDILKSNLEAVRALGLVELADSFDKSKIATKIHDMLCGDMDLACPIIFFHGDFAFRNILVVRHSESQSESHGKFEISGLIDWEWCGTRPMFQDLYNDFLEENNEQDRQENLWINDIVTKEYIFSQPIRAFTVRKALHELLDSISPWRLNCDLDTDKVIRLLELFCEIM